MKYYIYISTSKLSMLSQQLPEAVKSKLSSEFGVDWWLFKGKIGIESE